MKKTYLFILGGLLLATAISFGFYWPFSGHQRELQLPGVVEVFEVRLGSKVGGRVADVMVREGEYAEAKAELIRFAAPELEAQRDQLKAQVEVAKANLRKAENGPRPQELDEAKAQLEAAEARNRRMQNGWREEEKKQAKSDYETALAELELTQKNWERMQRLYAQASQTEYDTARANYFAASGRMHAARAKLAMLEKGSREEDLAEAAAEAARTRARYALLKAGTRDEEKDAARAQVSEIEAKLREVEANLREAVVVAPSKILVEVLGVRKGDLVAANQPAIRALSTEDRWVKVFVPSTELGKIHVGQSVEVTCDAYPGKRFPGSVIQIASISEFTPRNVQTLDERRHQVFAVKVRVDDNGEVFKAGMAAVVYLPLQEAP